MRATKSALTGFHLKESVEKWAPPDMGEPTFIGMGA